MSNAGLYIHIPFCKSKCKYCDFYSLCDLTKAERYVGALLLQFKEMQKQTADQIFDSVYIGGGTPTVIGNDLLLRVIEGVTAHFSLHENTEFTIEANPGTVDEGSLSLYRKAGVNRISFGVQSANDHLLSDIGRIHSFTEAKEAIGMARRAGFENISADLMYALPTQTTEDLLESIRRVAALGVEHISMYGLKVEENTPFGRDPNLVLPDEDAQCEMYLKGVALLNDLGYTQYEISNFSKEGYESRHNLKYWQRSPYVGAGCAAHSFFKGFRFFSPSSIDAFCSCTDFSLTSPFYSGERVEKEDAWDEELMLSLRTSRGIALARLYELCTLKKRCKSHVQSYVERLLERDYGRISDDGYFSLTPYGMLVSNGIIGDLLWFDE